MFGKILIFNDRSFSSNGFSKPNRRGVVVGHKDNRLLIALTRGMGKASEIKKREALAKKGQLLKITDDHGQDFYLTDQIVDSYFVPIKKSDVSHRDSGRNIDPKFNTQIESFLFWSKRKKSIGVVNAEKRKNFKSYR